MKRLITTACFILFTLTTWAQGIPFVTSFDGNYYNAHNRNFDITIDSTGTVWIANFEGLLYYDNATWRIVHTPGFARVTVTYTDDEGTIWVGGYNYCGKVQYASNGEPYLKQIAGKDLYEGEVQDIYEKDGRLKVLINNGNVCFIENDSLILERNVGRFNTGLNDIVDIDELELHNRIRIKDSLTQTIPLSSKYAASIIKGYGIDITDRASNRHLYYLNEDNGINTNNVAILAYNNKGILWGTSDKDVFAAQMPSPYTYFTPKNGLIGTVQAIDEYEGKIYAGTHTGLFVLDGEKFVRLPKFKNGCWALQKVGNELLCATSDGVYTLSGQQLSKTATFSLIKIDDNSFYAGCIDGVYYFKIKEKFVTNICRQEKVMKMVKDKEGTYWFQSLNGQIWYLRANSQQPEPFDQRDNDQASVSIADGKAVIVMAGASKPFEFPMFSHYDFDGIAWLTDNAGQNLYRWRDGKRLDDRIAILRPVKDLTIKCFFKKDGKIWLGSDNGITIIDLRAENPHFNPNPTVKIRTITAADSVVWGGFGKMPDNIGEFESDVKTFKFTYSLDNPNILLSRQTFRYRINNAAWSNWEDNIEAAFLNLHYGKYTFEVQGMTEYGILSNISSVSFSIKYPFYMRWYAMIFYALILLLLIYIFIRHRINKLKQDKINLENIVRERTAEIEKQRDEIQQKSETLEATLTELSNTQDELIRQEKMATVGKLTQGLIDRILNPLNYINNFSKLSIGLVGDISANIDDDKDKMDEENYEDTIDVLEMLKGNLQKVAEHGLSTTRTLKAMEEMLKDRTGGMVPTDIKAILHKNREVVSKYHETCIAQYGIKVNISLPECSMPIEGNPELLSKTFMSIINNGFYAVVKKAERAKYEPQISIAATVEGNKYIIKFYDNGIGIEDTIIDKVFDPFFTTKPTGEASGVGLYLSREIVQNHHGDISVKSEKNQYTEFKVVFTVENFEKQ
jgi:signal transduction histidine kinase/ligand-binding sensor domain-containing protein